MKCARKCLAVACMALSVVPPLVEAQDANLTVCQQPVGNPCTTQSVIGSREQGVGLIFDDSCPVDGLSAPGCSAVTGQPQCRYCLYDSALYMSANNATEAPEYPTCDCCFVSEWRLVQDQCDTPAPTPAPTLAPTAPMTIAPTPDVGISEPRCHLPDYNGTGTVGNQTCSDYINAADTYNAGIGYIYDFTCPATNDTLSGDGCFAFQQPFCRFCFFDADLWQQAYRELELPNYPDCPMCACEIAGVMNQTYVCGGTRRPTPVPTPTPTTGPPSAAAPSASSTGSGSGSAPSSGSGTLQQTGGAASLAGSISLLHLGTLGGLLLTTSYMFA